MGDLVDPVRDDAPAVLFQPVQDDPQELEHRQAQYLTNRLESDHGKLKRLIPRLPIDANGPSDDQGLRGDADVQERLVQLVDRRGRRLHEARFINRLFGLVA